MSVLKYNQSLPRRMLHPQTGGSKINILLFGMDDLSQDVVVGFKGIEVLMPTVDHRIEAGGFRFDLR